LQRHGDRRAVHDGRRGALDGRAAGGHRPLPSSGRPIGR
jgi:hypothetical protein